MKRFISYCLLLMVIITKAGAQLPLIDKGVEAEGIWFFPVLGDSLKYVYLPYHGELARNEDNLPRFSFMRYVMNMPVNNTTPNNTSSQTISVAEGGGILNFLVLYRTPEDLLENATQTLRRKLRNDSIKVQGPIVFESGRYALVSSILQGDASQRQKQILSVGNAPVLENSSVALSFDLSPTSSSILMENFKMATPDVSLVFDMGFSGLTEDYDAELDVDWSEVRKNQSFNAGVNIYFVAADVKLAFDELFKKQAIKLKVNGKNEAMDALMQTAYDKLLTLMFAPVQPEQLPPQTQGNLMSTLTQAITGKDGALGSKNTIGFSAEVGYQLKEMKTSGTTKLYFKGRSLVQRRHFITFNIGQLHHIYGANERIFRTASIYGPEFQKRNIVVGVDGDLEKEFNNMLNSVTVILEKNHLSGEKTTQSVLVNKNVKKADTVVPVLYYGYDKDSTDWLRYKQRTVWQFRGGASYESPWKTQDAAMINLYVPFKRKKISLEGDMEKLAQKDITAISIQISYPFFSQLKQERITLKTSAELNNTGFEITQPENQEEIDYNITWIKKNGELIQKAGKDKIGLIFIDDLP
jgi:hypothetical protein